MCKERIKEALREAESDGESSSSDSERSSSSSSGSSQFGLTPAEVQKKRKRKVGSKPVAKAKAAAAPRPEAEDPKTLEEARQALRMLEQLTPAAMWKNAIKEKDRAKRLETAGKKADALALAMTSMQEPVYTDAQQVHDKIASESTKINDLSTLFEEMRGCQDFPHLITNGPLATIAFKHLDNDTLTSVLMNICTKLLEARLRQGSLSHVFFWRPLILCAFARSTSVKSVKKCLIAVNQKTSMRLAPIFK
jgi:hypothetical protein